MDSVAGIRRAFMLLLFAFCYCVFAFAFTIAYAASPSHHHHARTRTQADTALTDVKALIEFKKSISIDPFDTLADWNQNAPTAACNWTGITCSTQHHPGRVVHIALENAAMVGTISPYLGNLSFLQVLDLANNSFSGEIPSSIGKLHSLKVLDLCYNHLDGPIPSAIGNLSSLLQLGLCMNALTREIPPSFAGLANLKELNLYWNLLTGYIPPFIAVLGKLQFLDFSRNKFEGPIPQALGNLSSLRHLDVSDNPLSGSFSVPCSLAKLPHLNTLDAEQTNIGGKFPLCLTNLTSLVNLNLSKNSLVGTIPSALGRLRNLESLALAENFFTGRFPEPLSNISSSLKKLLLSFNKLHGSLPTWISSFQRLQFLGLAGNNFSGPIPDSWSNATRLQVLDLNTNFLTGTIPSSFGKFTKISVLALNTNYLTSGVRKPGEPIPLFTSLSNLSELTVFRILENYLSGRLPSNIGNFWPKLQQLLLSHNLISGKIPSSAGNFSSLYSLDMNYNMLDGTIPSHLANIKSIQKLYLGYNRLHGKIPSEISIMNKTLAYLDLSANRLSGSIPRSMGDLVNLRELSLARNLLSGRIPAELGKCNSLESLVLSENQLWGTIPPEVAGLRNIIFKFDLSRNRLRGIVPAEIGGLQMAQYINLAGNQLSGNIGGYMQNWLDARQVNLSFNNFSGSMQDSFDNKLTQLQSLDLSYNAFMGSVPETLLNLSHLHYLNLSYNLFSGEISCLEFGQGASRLSYRNLTFRGNSKICGHCLGLPVCHGFSARHHSHSQRNRRILKIVLIATSSTAVFLLFCIWIFFNFKKARLPRGKTVWFRSQFPKISLAELETATNNFSSANVVGESRHGTVYRGVLRSSKTVAIKCFSCSDRGTREKIFKRECKILQNLRHRNIVKIITIVWSDNLKAIVMPFMNNGSLHNLLHGRQAGTVVPLNLSSRLQILKELAFGLSYLHHDCTPKIIHCDVKPENVLLDDERTVKLSDFGIARLIGKLDASSPNSSSAVKGSIGYIAPEYGTGAAVSEKGDVYSFGIVTLEVIARLKPTHQMFSSDLTLPKFVSMAFEGSTPQQLRQRLEDILRTADADGGGIDLESQEEMKAVQSILLVGLRCICEDAYRRPTMKEVESTLSSISVRSNANLKAFPENPGSSS